jgi:hypothetical protein
LYRAVLAAFPVFFAALYHQGCSNKKGCIEMHPAQNNIARRSGQWL